MENSTSFSTHFCLIINAVMVQQRMFYLFYLVTWGSMILMPFSHSEQQLSDVAMVSANIEEIKINEKKKTED